MESGRQISKAESKGGSAALGSPAVELRPVELIEKVVAEAMEDLAFPVHDCYELAQPLMGAEDNAETCTGNHHVGPVEQDMSESFVTEKPCPVECAAVGHEVWQRHRCHQLQESAVLHGAWAYFARQVQRQLGVTQSRDSGLPDTHRDQEVSPPIQEAISVHRPVFATHCCCAKQRSFAHAPAIWCQLLFSQAA